MSPLLVLFRLAALGALLLGLGYLLEVGWPRWTVDVHMLLGIIVVLFTLTTAWRLKSTLHTASALLALLVLVLGIGFRTGWWGGTALGLLHLTAAVAVIGLVEVSAARQRRAAGR